MKVLGSTVLSMEIFIMGFAMLLAKDIHEPATLIYGFAFMAITVLAIGLLRKKAGWILGSLLQFALMAYNVVWGERVRRLVRLYCRRVRQIPNRLAQ